ncbi:MAG: M23 family metallopeptidase [Xanthobacteraceae bacterium]
MSQWTASRSSQAARAKHSAKHFAPHPAHHPAPQPTQQSGRAPREAGCHPEPHARNAPEPAASAYTIAHAGRQIRFGPVAFWIAVGTVVIMAGWSITAATYLAFRDDVLRTLIARQAQQQFGYEDRIAELRAQIDRTTSRQLLDQEQFEQKLDELTHRQAALESRATALGSLGDPTTTGSIAGAALRGGRDPAAAPLRGDRGRQSGIGATLDRMEASLDRVDRRQALALGALDDRYETAAHRIRGILGQLGLKADAAANTGGPFVPVKLPPASDGFARALFRVNLARSELAQLNDTLRGVPLRQPVSGEIDETSPFGVRVDPFLHEAAMHTGMDIRGEPGEAVHATAAGRVSIAGWDGGYGNLVEIDHGNGLATRYGHLSQIDVHVGEEIRTGQTIGLIGSTGRSTGPHLHYETRVDGEAVNPQKFLEAGAKLFGNNYVVAASPKRSGARPASGNKESLD